jgi:hypothetical protein
MPSKSAKQARFMQAAAHNPEFAGKAGIPIGVAKEFVAADKAKKVGSEGRADRQKVNQPKTRHGDMALFSRGGVMAKGNKFAMGESMGKVKTAAPSRDGIAQKGKTKGKMIKMCGGGMAKKGK